MALQEDFQKASEDVKALSTRPTNENLLALYSLFKQATDGDIASKRPGMLDMKGRAKWDAWNRIKGTDKETAMIRYIELVNKLKST